MKVWSSALLLGALLLATTQSAAAQLRGRITRAGSTEPVAGAFVRLTGAATRMMSASANGEYAFAGLSAGEYCVLVDHFAYEPARACVLIGRTGALVLDLPLIVRPMPLAPVIVVAARDAIVRDAAREIGGRGPTVAQTEPFILSPTAGRTLTPPLFSAMREEGREPQGGAQQHALYLWGTSTERGRVLLDGASLNAPLHLGTLLPPFDPEVLSGAAMRTGGVSPRYDGAAAYIVEYTSRPASDRTTAWGELDLLTGRVGAETSLGEGGRILANARRVNDESIEGVLSPNFGYGYSDVFARADLRVSSTSGLYLSTFGTSENVRVPRDQSNDEAAWSNRAALLEWRSDRDAARRSAMVSLSRGTADLPLLTARGGHMRMGLERASATARQTWALGENRIEAGAELEHLRFERQARADEDPANGVPGPITCTRELPCQAARTTLASLFGGLSFSPIEKLSAMFGMRTTYDADASRMHLLPRASLTLLPARNYAISLSAGRFSQTESTRGSGVDQRMPLDVSHSTHVQLGLQHHSPRAFMNASANVRRYESPSAPDEQVVPGADLVAGYTTGVGTFSMAYTVSQPVLQGVGTNTTQQLIALSFAGEQRGVHLDVTAAYGAGVPITSIVLEETDRHEQAPPGPQPATLTNAFVPGGRASDREYFRVDATLGTEFRVRTGRMMPYLRIVNALSHRDALFYFQAGNVSQPAQELARLPAIPTIGLRWQF